MQSASHQEALAFRRQLQQISTPDELGRFIETIQNVSAVGKALARAASRHLQHLSALRQEAFQVDSFLSDDLSAVLFGGTPVIFLGSNDWAVKRFATRDELAEKHATLLPIIQSSLDQLGPRVHAFVVPEKDSVIDRLFLHTPEQALLDEATLNFLAALARPGLSTGYDEFLACVAPTAKEEDYAYYDSHLASRDYVSIFEHSIAALGLEPPTPSVRFERGGLYGDLRPKLADSPAPPEAFLIPAPAPVDPEILAGSQEFGSPLGDTRQLIRNDKAPIKASLAIYGDSHCSIMAMPKLTSLYVRTFELCDFRWNPMAMDIGKIGIPRDYTIMEIAQRFIF